MEHDSLKVVRVHTDNGARSGLLVATGRKYIRLLLMDYPLRITRLPLADAKYITELDYKVSRAKRRFREAAKHFHGGLRGCPKSVRGVIR